ncbi:MAG: glycosyltransferase family 4 protein [Candidatus Methanofastidiosa archaeon]|nr:glycosyltransferase family 4 protein [Candidatus Methanofastidiosa archaeon]
MRNILFLTLSRIEKLDTEGIYLDLVKALASNGFHLYVVTPREKRFGLSTELLHSGNIHLLKVKTGNITKTNFIEKGITTLFIQRQYLKAINTFFKDIHFDLLMFSTPPITFEKVVQYFKHRHKCIVYLMLKDIFPQNAVDLGLIKKNTIIYKYFRKKEKKIYAFSDYIGCMSPANMSFIIKNNPQIDENKVELFPNTIQVKPRDTKTSTFIFRKKFNIPNDAVLFIFGGNLGIPQGIDFLLDCLDEMRNFNKAYFLIVGDGTEKERIKKKVINLNLKNVVFEDQMEKEDYRQILLECDVGLILLDKRFTIPNYPSRILSYIDMSLPILAATDRASDIKDLLKEAECGLWSYSDNKQDFIKNIKYLCENKDLRIKMGQNGRKYLEQNFDISRSVNIIKSHLKFEDKIC